MDTYWVAYKATDGRWKCRLFYNLHNAYRYLATVSCVESRITGTFCTNV